MKTILNRIKKLLALTESPNENEASAAMVKAQDLMREYKLSLKEVKDFDTDKPDMQDGVSGNRFPMWQQHIFATVAKVFNCIAIREKGLQFFGSEVDATTAKMTLNYIITTIDRESLRVKSKGVKFINSYKLGMAMRISERLNDKFKEQKVYGNGEYGIVIQKNNFALNRALSKRGNYRNRQSRCSVGDSRGMNAGRNRGDDIGLDKQVGKAQQRLLK